ncbi:hypothetical protein ACHHYP_06098 [Achlya hypogyna]|uniref:Uncharacterized protein n=1 Tax=Achlya hypogyna TaxID=1202772 RepID=A0A1V9YVA4_ACHHY|nr:hypothetical protein ACHHYP_06098 [Achlya hypogyna]
MKTGIFFALTSVGTTTMPPCSDFTVKLALTPYAKMIRSYLEPCARDAGVNIYNVEASKGDPDVALRFVASTNCKNLFLVERNAFATITPPCMIEQFSTTMSTTDFATATWEDIVANTTAEAKNMTRKPEITYPPTGPTTVPSGPTSKSSAVTHIAGALAAAATTLVLLV